MLKVLHVTYDMRIGGTEMVIRNIIEGSDKSAFTMSIFCIESPLGPWGEALKNEGIQVTCTNRKDGFDVSLIGALRRHIVQNKIDIVHCHQYTPWVYGTFAALLTDAKVIFTEHGRFYPDSSSWKRRLVNPLLQLFTTKTTAISKATKQALVDFEFIPEKNIDVIYNGIKPLTYNYEEAISLKAQLNLPETTTVLGTIARFDPIKNHTMMLEAFARVLKANENCVLIMVGDGPERSTIEQKIAALNITDKVILTGYQPDPTSYLGIMDIFLLSSLSEGTSMTLLEAMSLSKPCVVTDAGGNAEIIAHCINGLVTPNDDANAFAQAIITLLAQGTSSMAQAAKSRFNNNFSASQMNSQFQIMYGSLNG